MVENDLVPFPESLASKTSAELEPLARGYREAIATRFPGAAQVTDKRPDNFLYIGLIKSLFPEAKIVHTTRDPLDNCLAIYFLHLDLGITYATDLMNIGHYYREYRRLMAHWRALYGADIIELNYDQFVREPDSVGPRVFEALGLGLGSQVSRGRAHRGFGQDRERMAGARAALSEFLGPLASLRESAGPVALIPRRIAAAFR